MTDSFEQTYAGRSVLITGGAGFIGSTLARRLVDLGAEVTVVDSLIPEYGGNLFNLDGYHDRLRFNVADVRDGHAMAYLVKDQDYLFNLAGQTSHMDSMEDPFTDLEINCRAQLSILETCRWENPEARIVFASTRQLYGKPEYLPVDEMHPTAPVDVNGVNKLAGEGYHMVYSAVHGLRASVLRLTNTYGPRMRVKDARQTFVGVWIRDLVQGKCFEVWEGDQLRDFTYVDDAVDAFLLAGVSDYAPGRIFNVGGDERINLRELADLLVEANEGGDYSVQHFPEDRKRIDIGDYYTDWSRVREELNWQPAVSLSEGLRRTLAYYREHLQRYL